MIAVTNTSESISCVLRFIVLAFLIALMSDCSLFSSVSADDWVSLGSPPSGVASVIAASGSEIWVSSNEGGIYTANVHFHCDS
ncbi:MAG TPA: hypothetical protein VK900_02640, partial [Anaerolineales bacterium]|nr:hypothetical protein [Anaerolineales bacterium]